MNRFLKLVLALVTVTIIWLSPSLVVTASCYFLNSDVGYVCVPELETAHEHQFTTLEPPKDTLFGRRSYGRLADNANVFPEPTRSVPPVRNVGDGYLFATISRQLTNESGETWYQINPGE